MGYMLAWGYPHIQDIYANYWVYHFVLEDFQEMWDMGRVLTTTLVNDGRNLSLTGMANERAGDDSSTKEETMTAQTPAVAANSPKRDAGNLPEKNGEKWTETDEKMLIALWLQGTPPVEMGIKLGRSVRAIYTRFWLLSPPIAMLLNHQANEIKRLKEKFDEQDEVIRYLMKELEARLPKAG